MGAVAITNRSGSIMISVPKMLGLASQTEIFSQVAAKVKQRIQH